MYYPKSQIQTNLYTNGADLAYESTGIPYTGYYYKTSSGRYYSGKTPNDPLTESLIPLEINVTSPNYENSIQSKINAFGSTPTSPTPIAIYQLDPEYVNSTTVDYGRKIEAPVNHKIYPTDKDYELGQFQRYFVKKINSPLFKELSLNIYKRYKDKDQYVQYDLYIPFEFVWTITGKDKNIVANINYSVLELTEQRYKVIGLVKYFQGKYSEFYK